MTTTAFPHHEDGMSGTSSGMTLREYFAAHADVQVYCPLDSFISANGRRPTIKELADYIAQIRVTEADAMLAQREKEQTK